MTCVSSILLINGNSLQGYQQNVQENYAQFLKTSLAENDKLFTYTENSVFLTETTYKQNDHRLAYLETDNERSPSCIKHDLNSN